MEIALLPMLFAAVLFGLSVAGVVLLVLRVVRDPGGALRSVSRLVVAGIVAGGVLFALAAASYMWVGLAKRPAVSGDPSRSVERDEALAQRPAWLDAGEYLAASADVHPSRAAALRALAAKLDEVIGTRDEGAAPVRVRLFGGADAATRKAFAAELRRVSDGVVFDAEDAGAVGVRLDEVGLDPERGGSELWAGVGDELVSTRWVDKPWVENFEGYREASQAGRDGSASGSAWPGHLAVAQSLSPAVTEREAMDLAYRDAAEALAARVGGPGPWERRPELAARFEAELREGRFIADRFVQRFERPSGDVYRALLLVDAPGEARAEVVSQLAVREQRRGFSAAESLVGLVVLVSGVYLVLRVVTGPYDGRGIAN